MNGFHDPNMQKPAYGQGIQQMIQQMLMMMIMKKMMGGQEQPNAMAPMMGNLGNTYPKNPYSALQGMPGMMQRRPF